jgi:hypothetical protein
VDKILKGATPSNLPAQQPTKFELVVNMKTAKELGLSVSPQFLQLVDVVIEEPNVRYWPLVDIPWRTANVRFRG